MNAKKILALLLALVMVFALVACGNDPVETSNPGTNESPDVSDPVNSDPINSDPAVPDTYTYNYALSTFPTLWNYFTYETATDAEILDYITDGFYTFDYNETKDGYQMVPAMATGDPVDVTDQYIGQYGLVEGDTARAYIVPLRDDLKWEDGTVINATTFVESMKRLLAPEAQNYRADSVYAGSFVIHGAKDYLYSGQTVWAAADSIQEIYSEDLDATLYFTLGPAGETMNAAVSFRASMGFPDSYDAAATAAYVISNYLPEAAFNAETAAAMEGKTLAEIKADATLKAAWDALIGWWQTDPNEELDFFVAESTYPEYSFDNVGVKAISDTELLIVMDKPLEGFYLKYNMFIPLVHAELYDSLSSVEDGVFSTTYGTSADTVMSYGPYKLTAFQADKQYTLTRNDEWYGITEDTYQTTAIVVDYVPEAATRLELFLQGKLDSYGLSPDDMDEYSMSDYCYYATGASTFALTFNPDMTALTSMQANAGENINKTILTIKEFRMAMSLALNRAEFCLATSPVNGAAFGLYSNLIVSDPEAGTAYRTTQPAKEVLAEFWGVSEDYGEGKLYADLDEAVASITGYNLTKAQQMFDAAYDAAIAQGLMDADDVVEICIGTPNNTSQFYNNGYEFLVNNYTEAVKGTKLEGKLQFTRDDTLGNGFADALNNNQVDMLFGVGWSGSALDPYGLMEAYVSQDYQYDDSVDFTQIDCTITINGVDYTTDVWTWYEIMNGTAHTITSAGGTSTLENYSCGSSDGDPETRLNILAALEGAVLLNYNFIPIMDESSASLKGQQYNYYTEEYVFGMGFGGVKYYTYNYSDAAWDAYVEDCGGTLSYN